MSDAANKVFQAFGDHFFATRGRPSKEAVDDLHAAMDEIAYGDVERKDALPTIEYMPKEAMANPNDIRTWGGIETTRVISMDEAAKIKADLGIKEHDPYDCDDEDCELCKQFRREGDG